VKGGRGRGIGGLPLFVSEAAHHGQGVFWAGEEARAGRLAAHSIAEDVVPPRGRENWRCGARGVACAAGPAPSGGSAAGHFDGGAGIFVLRNALPQRFTENQDFLVGLEAHVFAVVTTLLSSLDVQDGSQRPGSRVRNRDQT
jgi:hypothetical protein